MKRKLLLFSLLLMCGVALQAQPVGWSQAKRLAVTENSGTPLTDYQLKIYVDTQAEILAGNMQPDGDDIRFGPDCPGTSFYNHWIQGPMNDDSTVIWVKVPSLPANATTAVFMYHGNPSATGTSAVQGTFVGPHSSTDSVASGSAGGVGNSQRGFRFSPTQDILVQSFGKREPTGTTRYVTLFNYATQAILHQQQISGPAAQYSYGALPQPMWLTAGTQYILELFQGSGDGYYFGTSSQIGLHLVYYDMRYCNSCTQNTFPTSALGNYHYGYPDMWYYTKSNVSPAPTYVVGTALEVIGTDIMNCEGAQLTLGATINGASGSTNCTWSPSGGLSSSTDCNPTMTLDSTTYYVVSVTDSIGCSGSDTVWVVNGTPEVVASSDSSTICVGDTVLMTATGCDFYTWGPGGSLNSTSGDSVWAFPGVSTTYSVIGTDSVSGCTDTMQLQVNVSTVAVDVVAGQLNMCEGDSLVITVSGADTYSWSPGASLDDSTSATVIATPSADVTYTIMGYDTLSGCMASGSIQVLVHPLPVVAFDLPNHFCDIDPPSTLSSGTPAGGTYSGTNVSNGIFTPGTAGNYVLTYTYADAFGCEASDTALAIVDVCISVTPTLAVDLMVYPNPSEGVFTVSMGVNPETTHFRVHNMMGQMVQEGALVEGKNILDLSGCSSGLYILSVESAGMRRSFNIEVKR